MRVAVMGAGAVGGYFGARLAEAGADVTFMARGEHLRAMQRHGLRITSVRGDLAIHGRFAAGPDGAGPADLVLLAVKSQDTDAAARALTPLVGRATPILSLQNGVDNAECVARLWGADRSVAGVAYITTRVAAPGVIEHSGGGQIILGATQPGGLATARAAHAILAEARIPCELSAHIGEALWKKLAWNAPFCALACLLRMTVGEILASPGLDGLVRACIEEVREAAAGRGVALPASTAQDLITVSAALRDVKPSMLHDLEAGKPLEHEALNGVVVRALQQVGRRAPVNELLYASLARLDQELRARR
jgi:2-dehydropantoate 2-reductase